MQVIVNTYGASIRRQGERFVIRTGGKEQALSAHKVTGLLIATGATLTTDAIQLASEHNIDIVFLDKFGDPYARVWLPRHGSTTANQRVQAALYGLLIGERYGVPVTRAYLCYTRSSHRVIEIPLTEVDFADARSAVSEVLEVIRLGWFPGPTRWEGRCRDCCYRNICTR